MQADFSTARLKYVKLKHEFSALSSESGNSKRSMMEPTPSSRKDTLQSSSHGDGGVRLDMILPASAAAADILTNLRRKNVVINPSSIASAIKNCLADNLPSDDVFPPPKLELCLGALNAHLQQNSYDERLIAGISECRSHARSFAKCSIDEHWLAGTLLAVCNLCTENGGSFLTLHDFAVFLCRDLAAFAGDSDHRSVIIIRTIACVASFLRMPTLLLECFCLAFNASPHLIVIPSLLFHAAFMWIAPFSNPSSSSYLLPLFISCIFDKSAQAALSKSEAAHAVAFLHMICSSHSSLTNVAQVVPCCVAGLSGTNVDESYVACKFAVSILDPCSIQSSVLEPIMSLLRRHFVPLLSAPEPPAHSESCHPESLDLVHAHEASGSSQLSSANVACSIVLLGYSALAIVQQSESCLRESFCQISTAVKFLFSICSRADPPCMNFKDSSPSSLSSSEASSYSLIELLAVACSMKHHTSQPSDFHSINSMESLWRSLLTITSSDSSNSDSFPLHHKRRRDIATNEEPH
jgi:hypothetical protein